MAEFTKKQFEVNLQKWLKNQMDVRNKRPLPPPGQRYNRDWYDRLKAEGKLSSSWFINEANLCLNKQSKEPKQIRDVVMQVMILVTKQTPGEIKK